MDPKTCPTCKKTFTPRDARRIYCGRSCAALGASQETKAKQAASIKARHDEGIYRTSKHRKKMSQAVGKSTRTGRKITSLWEVSSRTRMKVLRRLNLGCSRCGWKEEICDVHHIHGRKVPNADSHLNCTLLCPNCHRLADRGRRPKEELKTLDDILPENWQDAYYG